FHERIRDFHNVILFRPVAIVSTIALVTPHHRPYRPSMSRPRHRRIGEISGVLVCGPPISGFRISKFRCYVSFRRSLRAPHHIGASHLTSTDADEAGIFDTCSLRLELCLPPIQKTTCSSPSRPRQAGALGGDLTGG